MSRKKLIKQLLIKNPSLNNNEIANLLDIFSRCISDALFKKNSVEIRNFGRWYLKRLKENFNARNPSSNKLIYKPERFKVKFKLSKKLKKIINE